MLKGDPKMVHDRSVQMKDDIGVLQAMAILWRRKGLILSTSIVLILLATALILSMTPKYTASSEILLDVHKTKTLTNVTESRAPAGNSQVDDAAMMRSEVEVISSPALLKQVIADLGLLTNPHFQTVVGVRTRIMRYLAEVLPGTMNYLFPGEDVSELRSDEPRQPTMADVVQRLQTDLGFYNDQGRNYVIRVSYTSEDPELAARIVNAVVQQYINSQLEGKYQAIERMNHWLEVKIADLKNRVESSDEAVQAYRQANDLLNIPAAGMSTGGSIAGQELSDLNTQLAIAQADAAQKHGALRQFQSTLKEGIDRATKLPEVMASPTISALKVQEADANRRIADLGAQFGDKYPAVIRAQQERAAIEDRIGAEMQKVTGAMATEAQAADFRVERLRSELARSAAKVQQNNQADVKLQELERQAQANRVLYEAMLNRYTETSVSQDIQQPDATVISRADVPMRPSFPNKPLFVFMAALASLCLGVALALFADRLDNSFRTGAQIEEYTGVHGIGMLPKVSNTARDGLTQNLYSPFSESIRTIRSAIILANMEQPPRVILVTSAAPGEGKSTMALALARASAQAGVSTLLLDCDWRRPSLHTIMGMRNDVSLLDMFQGKTEVEGLIQTDSVAGVSFIAGRQEVHNPNDLLGGRDMKVFLNRALTRYELIVLDSPPVMAASDAVVLSRLVDATLFVVRWGTTRRQVVVNAIRILQKAEARFAGVVISRVDVRKHRRYGFGDQVHYYDYHRPIAKVAKARAEEKIIAYSQLNRSS
jgi:polysaccharide biosynthesis transport protein